MLYGKSILAIIPVRFGSKRLKLKNIRIFKGKCLFLNTLSVAKKCKYIDSITISSEKKKFVSIFDKKKIFFRHRPKKFAKDKSKASDVIIDVLTNTNFTYDYFIYLQPTSPLRNIFDIESSLKKAIYKNKKSLISVSENNSKPNGAIYISKVKEFINNRKFENDKFSNYKMPKQRSIDIDYLKDFEKALRL